MIDYKNKFIAFILAAGKGTRIQEFTDTPKVLLELNKKTLLGYAIEHVENFGIGPIIVVAYKKDEIINKTGKYNYIEQIGFPGTGGALMAGLKGLDVHNISEDIENIIVLQGDDTAFLQNQTIESLMNEHVKSNASITLLTTNRVNPTGFGRIVRNNDGIFQRIVEEKNASEYEKGIKEVNTGVWCFNRNWLSKNISKLKPNEVINEYYATDLIEIASDSDEIISTVNCPDNQFFGINTKEQYFEAIDRLK